VPAVILFNVPTGVRGFLLVAFIAAAFSSFNSTINAATGYFTRDIYQRFLHIKANNKELIFASYFFIVCMVSISYVLAYNFNSITQIWGWIVMGLGGGLAIPAMLKFYWWRYNGSGFAIGTTVGIITAIAQTKIFPDLFEWQQFLLVSIIALIATIIGTFLTSPTEENVLDNFYRSTRPFGFWKPYKEKLDPQLKEKMEREHKNDLISVPFTLGWQISLFLLPMQLMVKTYKEFFITLTVFIICLSGMYWFWYRNLPPKEKKNDDNIMAGEAIREII
jgi:Na+/proline symporter